VLGLSRKLVPVVSKVAGIRLAKYRSSELPVIALLGG
jgi:hypothetical protein